MIECIKGNNTDIKSSQDFAVPDGVDFSLVKQDSVYSVLEEIRFSRSEKS